jgi:exopolyphosphatase/guanosine-5'-triphosphate,3'-diphosphate pyrophosphatase
MGEIMQRIAIIDIGSNSARLVITQMYKSGAYNMVYNQKEALRLSQKINKKGELTETAFNDTLECMRSFSSMCELFHADKIIAVATAAIRNAPNGEKLAFEVKEATGIALEIISGKTEAYMSYLGVINTLDVKDAIIFDLGGGSTEIILVQNRKMVDSISLPIGCVNLTSAFNSKNKITPAIYAKMRKAIAIQLNLAPWIKTTGLPLIGVGGTARTIGKMEQKRVKYFTSKIHNYQFAIQNFKNTFKQLLTTSLTERKHLPGLSSERADIILAGAAIIKALADRSKAKKMIVSGCGLREGMFLAYYAPENNQPLITEDILADSCNNAFKLYTPDSEHSEHVTKLALAMYDSWEPLHKLDARWRQLLRTAALLHDIGITINYYSHARHSAYMIENAKLFGLTHKEQVLTAIIAGWHNGISRSYLRNKQYKELLTDLDLKRLGMASLLLALAESLDYSQTNQVSEICATISKKTAVLNLTAAVIPTIELHQLKQQLHWFDKAFGLPLIIKTHT